MTEKELYEQWKSTHQDVTHPDNPTPAEWYVRNYVEVKLLPHLTARRDRAEITNWTVGLLVMFGLPAIFWVYLDWRAALTAFIVGQLIIGFAKLSINN